jgi:hypothetical protein
VYFYNPDKDYVTGFNLVNKIVAGLSPPFSHVELQFPFGMACSIVMNETVRIRESTFDPEFYTGVVLHAPPQAVFKMLALTQLHVERGIPFGVIAGHTFCSKLVAELLRDSGLVSANVLTDTHTQTFISPSALYEKLSHRLPGHKEISHLYQGRKSAEALFSSETGIHYTFSSKFSSRVC